MSPGSSVEPTRESTDVLGARIGAQIIDLIRQFVQLLVVVFVLVTVLARVDDPQPGQAEGLTALAMLTLPLYGGLLEGYWNGQTVGKRVPGIAVVDSRGNEPTVGQAVVRNLPAVILFSWVTSAVALAAIATSERNQRVFDNVAGTYVVRSRAY
jgi:uncharacterized RDD family membrane protein YckC